MMLQRQYWGWKSISGCLAASRARRVFGTGRRALGRRWARGAPRHCSLALQAANDSSNAVPRLNARKNAHSCAGTVSAPGRAAHRCSAGRCSPGLSTALLIGGKGYQYWYKSSAVTQYLSTSPLPQSRESRILWVWPRQSDTDQSTGLRTSTGYSRPAG